MHDGEKRKEYFDNALDLYSHSKLNQKDYLRFINISLKMYNEEDYNIAESYALLAYSIKPSIKISNILGSIYFKLRDYDKALSYFHDVYAKLPVVNIFIVSNIAHCYEQKNSFSIALRYIEKALDIYPRSERLYYDMGLIHISNNDKPSAMKAFKNASDINPSFSFDMNSI
jgi:tetratricopeptide (TPR) repeat protein